MRGPSGIGPWAGHLGSWVSALVDDQLSPADAERGWRHVQGCRACREAVQQELWVKDRLHRAPGPGPLRLPDPGLTAALAAGLPGTEPDLRHRPEHRRGLRRAGVAAVGVGTVTAALTAAGLLADDAVVPPGPEPSGVTASVGTP